MTIIEHPSLNFNDRALPISWLVLHYTGMKNGELALERLCNSQIQKPVSAHYLVEEDGRVFQLVAENKRAWHAGISAWQGQADMNSASIGIEIVNGGHDFGLPDFSLVQMQSVMQLASDILARHNLNPLNVLGHSDIAPARKMDPGERFPWSLCAKSGIGLWPPDGVICEDRRILFDMKSRDRGVAIVQRGLAFIGYDIEVSGVLDRHTCLVIAALQRRYRPDQIDGQIDVQTMDIVKWLAEQQRVYLSRG